ncbi:DNA methyltransferase, partial [Candidatus Binatus sp.]|uniref:DNA methyltransferase n=1 Tax=Candidatus Binatus sp. TaxID=2811406 RepID=UPI003BAF8408
MTTLAPREVDATIATITDYIVPQKQAAKRHYGSHQYFTKRAWNVVQAYIKQFTGEGDVVCDPYGGSGVTVIEALVLGRKGIYLDISRWAGFLAQQVAIAPVNLSELSTAFQQVEKGCASKINKWSSRSAASVASVPIKRWFPKDYPLPNNADVPLVEDLFTHRQLLCLSELYFQINKVKDSATRDLLRYAFSATLYMCNRTFISAKGRKESRGGSSIFSIYRYKVAKKVIELNPFSIFKGRVAKLVACKKETNQLIGTRPEGSGNAQFLYGYAQRLTDYVKPESVDYIFTDPPYGAHISYLDLTKMWDAWLGFEVSAEDLDEETIEDGDAKHTPEHFKNKLADGIQQMFSVLKYDRWMSLVFAHREPAMWDTIIKAAEAAGFEYVNTVAQPLNVIWSMHKKKNPLTVLSGELILNFRKVRNPRTLAITSVGSDAVSLIR